MKDTAELNMAVKRKTTGDHTSQPHSIRIIRTTSNPEVGRSSYVIKFRTVDRKWAVTSIAREDFNSPTELASEICTGR